MKKVLLIGKANSGKSTLFNYLTGRNISMVGDTKGLTRDVVRQVIYRDGKTALLIDSGGLGERFTAAVSEKRDAAMKEADSIIFLLNAQNRFNDEDEKLYRKLLHLGKPFIAAVNKVDNKNIVIDQSFYRLNKFSKVSAAQRKIDDIIHFIFDGITYKQPKEAVADLAMRVAIVGKPNAGKSSIINQILGKEQNIVSEIAGTTIDTIDSLVKTNYGNFIFIDTAGLTRKRKDRDWEVAKAKALSMIAASSIVVLIFDVCEAITKEDITIMKSAIHNKKCLLIVANKVDKAEIDKVYYRKWFSRQYKFLSNYPLILTSAVTGYKVGSIPAAIKKASDALTHRLSKKELDQFLNKFLANKQISYIYQKAEIYPLFVIKVKRGYNGHTTRYVINQLYKNFDFLGAPIEIVVMKSEKRGKTR